MPFFDSAIVKPFSVQCGALKSHSPYPESQPSVGTGQLGAEPLGPSFIRIAARGPNSVMGWSAVPACWVRKEPRYVPGASLIVCPGCAAARAAWSSAAVDTLTVDSTVCSFAQEVGATAIARTAATPVTATIAQRRESLTGLTFPLTVRSGVIGLFG